MVKTLVKSRLSVFKRFQSRYFRFDLQKLMLLSLIILNLSLIPIASQAGFLPMADENYQDTFVTADGDTALEQSTNITVKVINIARILIGSVAVFMAIVSAVQMLSGNEESNTNAKKAIIYSIVGLVIVALSADLARLFDLGNGGLIGSKKELANRVRIFDGSIRVMITFIKYIIGSIAIALLIQSGLRMVTMGENEDEVSKDKKRIFTIGVGLVALIFVDTMIRNVLYKMDDPLVGPTIDLKQGTAELVGFVNMIVTIVSPIAILSLVAGGVWYAASMGNEESQGKAKKMMITSLLGIILIYGAFGIVSTLIIGKF